MNPNSGNPIYGNYAENPASGDGSYNPITNTIGFQNNVFTPPNYSPNARANLSNIPATVVDANVLRTLTPDRTNLPSYNSENYHKGNSPIRARATFSNAPLPPTPSPPGTFPFPPQSFLPSPPPLYTTIPHYASNPFFGSPLSPLSTLPTLPSPHVSSHPFPSQDSPLSTPPPSLHSAPPFQLLKHFSPARKNPKHGPHKTADGYREKLELILNNVQLLVNYANECLLSCPSVNTSPSLPALITYREIESVMGFLCVNFSIPMTNTTLIHFLLNQYIAQSMDPSSASTSRVLSRRSFAVERQTSPHASPPRHSAHPTVFTNIEELCLTTVQYYEYLQFVLYWIYQEYYTASPKILRPSLIQTYERQLEDVYEKLERIGQGQFGIVYKVKDKNSNQILCCKSIPKTKTSIPTNFILNEINILKQLDHPNIVKIFECFQDAKHIHLICEYVPGEELLQVLLSRGRKDKALTEPEACSIMHSILSSISHCHTKNIMHKDLKPENVMLIGGEKDLLKGQIKVIDFGLAEIFHPGACSTTAAGTPYYMAPEVFHHKFNYKCDVWSVGILLYLLLTSHLPFDAANKEEYIKVVNGNSVSFPKELFKNVSIEAQNLIRRLLNKNPAMRPSAAEALRDEWFVKFDANTEGLYGEVNAVERSAERPDGYGRVIFSSTRERASFKRGVDDLGSEWDAGLDGGKIKKNKAEISTYAPTERASEGMMSPGVGPFGDASRVSEMSLGEVVVIERYKSPARGKTKDRSLGLGKEIGVIEGEKLVSPLRKLTKQGSKLLNYANENPLRRLCHYLLAVSLHTEMISIAPLVFRTLDINRDGILSESEFAFALQTVGIAGEDTGRIFDALDIDDSGSLTYTEFIAAFIDAKKEEVQPLIKATFRKLDADGDGFITFNDVLNITDGHDEEDKDLLMEVFEGEMDQQGTGRVNYEDFASFLTRTSLDERIPSVLQTA